MLMAVTRFVHRYQVAELEQSVTEAAKFADEAIQQSTSLINCRRNLQEIAELLELQVEEVLAHYKGSKKARVSWEAEMEGLKTQLEMLQVLKEKLGQDKIELQVVSDVQLAVVGQTSEHRKSLMCPPEH